MFSFPSTRPPSRPRGSVFSPKPPSWQNIFFKRDREPGPSSMPGSPLLGWCRRADREGPNLWGRKGEGREEEWVELKRFRVFFLCFVSSVFFWFFCFFSFFCFDKEGFSFLRVLYSLVFHSLGYTKTSFALFCLGSWVSSGRFCWNNDFDL